MDGRKTDSNRQANYATGDTKDQPVMIAFSLIVFHAIVVPVFPWVGAGRTKNCNVAQLGSFIYDETLG